MCEGSDANRLLPLFRRLPYSLVPAAVAAGRARGRFFAFGDQDDAEDGIAYPELAILWDEAYGLYIAGDFTCLGSAARSEATSTIRDIILPMAKAPGLIVFPDPSLGTRQLADLFQMGEPIAYERLIYRLDPAPATPRSLPNECRLTLVNEAFFRRTDVAGRETLDEWLAECWLSLDAFAAAGFGVAAMLGNEIVGWCMAEYVADGRCGIGIETAAAHRGRGVATVLGRTFVAEAVVRGLTAFWDSWASNYASIAVAERLGFIERVRYPVYRMPI